MVMDRVRWVRQGEYKQGTVIYLMNRDERMRDNWALIFASRIAKLKRAPLLVVFNLMSHNGKTGRRRWDFQIEGLIELEQALKKKNITFCILVDEDAEGTAKFIKKHDVGFLVTDFSPLRNDRKLLTSIAKHIEVPFAEVDAHNIVPCFAASPKAEFGAHTLRPKITKQLVKYLDEFPNLPAHPYAYKGSVERIDWKKISRLKGIDESVKAITWAKAGERAAQAHLRRLLEGGLEGYSENRNDPTLEAQSGLSPYLHFGMISPQRVALAVRSSNVPKKDREAFLEELIVRRELSDNFCFYNPNYDNAEGFPDWGRKNHDKHRHDKREYLYSLKEFEAGKTHDLLWNAAQVELVESGKMHGYLRMYWAKKILEWTRNPEEAMKFAIHLNDKYSLDGRDPNGYAGIAWSIGGVHDRAWGERAVYGKIRSMTFNGAKGKFDVKAYIKKWL
jgi:deoxyribodipyrimidine photo-lyase